MPRPIYAEIDAQALTHNLKRVRALAGNREVWAVVKANAYGHGLDNAVKAFEGAEGLATIDLDDAARARSYGWTKRILLLEGFFDAADLEPLAQLNVETIIHSDWQIAILKASGVSPVGVHIKVNTGMNRLGFAPDDVNRVKAELAAIPGVTILSIVTHFANAEPSYLAEKPTSVSKQLTRLSPAMDGTVPGCMANSAAILWRPEVEGTSVRAGVALYGVSPDHHVTSEELGIIPAMTLAARIIAVQNVAEGETVGYGARWTAKRPSRIAVVACGYADGYPRTMPDGAPTWVNGKIAPLVGAVSMDMLEIDITDIPDADVGSLVELWGKNLPVNRVAQACGTIGYELICALALRVPLTLKA